MTRRFILALGRTLLAAVACAPIIPSMVQAQNSRDVAKVIAPFVEKYCVDCHGKKDPEGNVNLHSLAFDAKAAQDIETWKRVYEQLFNRQMPPPDADQPRSADRQVAIASIKSMLKTAGATVDEAKFRSAGRGNWVDHAALFSEDSKADSATTERVWRLTGPGYLDFMKQLDRRLGLNVQFFSRDRVTAPWQLTEQRDFADYSTAHRIGESELEGHLRNSEKVAPALVARLKIRRDLIPELSAILQLGTAATDEQVRAAVAASFDRVLSRKPDDDELQRYGGFLKSNLKSPGGDEGMGQYIIALLCHPSVLYRIEAAPADGKRALLPPRDLARAVAMTITDREPDKELYDATVAGKLTTREEVQRHVTRILADKSITKPRIPQFFREYFGYTAAKNVFKDGPTLIELGAFGRSFYEPEIYIADADRLILWILDGDRQVLRELLTTPNTFPLSGYVRQIEKLQATPVDARPPARKSRLHAGDAFLRLGDTQVDVALAAYELSITADEWRDRPFAMPSEHRMGLLTHPAWLIAQSGNFDNHAIHRGRWIREKLLGGRVPDVPITVNAMLPDDPGRTLRDRMQVTREEYCWKCHQQMDPLGLPFEQFDHIGRFRTSEQVIDTAATNAKNNLDRAGVPIRRIPTTKPLDTTGGIERSGDPQLDEPVKDPFELIRKLANSEYVEQVFVRHAFRFFLGRNETLADGPTLRAAHRAYRDNDGSMNALITSLVTSDSFLYRTAGSVTNDVATQGLQIKGGRP